MAFYNGRLHPQRTAPGSSRGLAPEHCSILFLGSCGTLRTGMRYERITLRSDQMGGQPCIRGLRIPVATVVQRDDIAEALRYAAEAVRERELPIKTVA